MIYTRAHDTFCDFFLLNSEKSSKFAADMRQYTLLFIFIIGMVSGCHRSSKVEQYRAQKRAQDSVRLEEQVRSLAYYEGQLETMGPKADSLLAFFSYERNEKYQDHGFYVVKNTWLRAQDYRILVRDDGREILTYRNGKRIEPVADPKFKEAYRQAEELQVTIKDIKELEKRIYRTSLEVQKHQKRLQNE